MGISKRVSLDLLRPGIALSAPISDPESPHIRLLGKGAVLTEAFINALRRRGVESVIMASHDIAALTAFRSSGRRFSVPPAPHYVRSTKTNEFSLDFDERLQHSRAASLPISARPLADRIDTPEDCGFADGLTEQWAADNNVAVDQTGEFFADAVDQRATDLTPLFETCATMIARLKEDRDALVCLASTPYETEYPSRHAVHVCGVAISIGVEMGLDEDQLTDLGVGCLIHDAGMQAVGLRMFASKQSLSPLQLARLADHPVVALQIACSCGPAISDSSKLVAYQIHERCDGSGYPRGWTAERIDPLAKIAAVADAYVGMLTVRKHRVAIQGYYVMTQLLNDLKSGKYDVKVIRALLNAASLYPLGSFVELSNGCVGRVIRSGRDRFVEPTIQMWHPDHRDREGVIVNLKRERELRITRAIPEQPAALGRAA